MKNFVLASALGCSLLTASPQRAEAYDIDCAIILCMAGGFPPSAVCARAYRTMIRRITPWPSRPPFGICTFAAVPVALGGPGGQAQVDTSLPEYDWLNRTRVIWWSLRREGELQGGVWYNWTIRSCDGENRTCLTIEAVTFSDDLPAGTFTTENGQVITRPGSINRGIMIEFGDHDGDMSHSDWFAY